MSVSVNTSTNDYMAHDFQDTAGIETENKVSSVGGSVTQSEKTSQDTAGATQIVKVPKGLSELVAKKSEMNCCAILVPSMLDAVTKKK